MKILLPSSRSNITSKINPSSPSRWACFVLTRRRRPTPSGNQASGPMIRINRVPPVFSFSMRSDSYNVTLSTRLSCLRFSMSGHFIFLLSSPFFNYPVLFGSRELPSVDEATKTIVGVLREGLAPGPIVSHNPTNDRDSPMILPCSLVLFFLCCCLTSFLFGLSAIFASPFPSFPFFFLNGNTYYPTFTADQIGVSSKRRRKRDWKFFTLPKVEVTIRWIG